MAMSVEERLGKPSQVADNSGSFWSEWEWAWHRPESSPLLQNSLVTTTALETLLRKLESSFQTLGQSQYPTLRTWEATVKFVTLSPSLSVGWKKG